MEVFNDMMRGTFGLYDVVNDPFETRNLVETQKEKAEELEMTLTSWANASLLAESGL